MKTLGKYELLDKLGEGSMGVIYRARDQVLDREVALKTLSTAGVKDTELLERFYREARACAKLRHPNIVTVYDFGREKDVAYIAMELLVGSDLKKIIASGTPMPLREKLSIMAAVCDGLAHAHSGDIVHRDIKPSNIFVDIDGQPRILDFGVAHMPLSSLTIAGRVLGTPYYMSPEQMLGQTCDGRSDIFSTAIVAFELISGQHPFRGNPLDRIAEGEPDSLLDYCPDLPIEVDTLLQKALSRDSADRYSSAAEFAAALRQAAAGPASFGRGSDPTAKHPHHLTEPRRAAGTETIMSAVLINLQKFEDAADRRDLTAAREALAGMRQAGAQDSRYAVALEQSSKRLAELENSGASLSAELVDNRSQVRQPAPQENHGFDATVLFDTYVKQSEPPMRPERPLQAEGPPHLTPPHRSRIHWAIWAGVLLIVTCTAAFFFTRRTDREIESLPASIAVPSVSQPPQPTAAKPMQSHTEPAATSHSVRQVRPAFQFNPIEVKAKSLPEPALDSPPQNLLPAQSSTTSVEPPVIAAEEKPLESVTPLPPPPVHRVAPDLETQRKAGQDLFERMVARLGDVDSPPALSLSGSATLWTGGQRTDWGVAGTVNVTGRMLTLEIQEGDLKWRISLKERASKTEGSNKLKSSAIALEMERLSHLFYDNQPAVLAARFKAAGPAQMLCDLSTNERGDRVLEVQVGADRYRVLIAPDGTPLRLHVRGLEIAYASFNDIRGYLYPRVFTVRDLAANAPPASVLLFDTVKVTPTLFGNTRER